MKIELHLPRESKTGNFFAYSHWRLRTKDRHAWAALLVAALSPHWSPVASNRKLVRITCFRTRVLDDDNLSSGLKHLRDCLTRLGLIKDDSPQWATFSYVQRPCKESPTKKPHTIVTIDDITERP